MMLHEGEAIVEMVYKIEQIKLGHMGKEFSKMGKNDKNKALIKISYLYL